jgi:UDP-GlcNAc:undecaprenyl-phosphate GlcNAc-1-phosphate transferase
VLFTHISFSGLHGLFGIHTLQGPYSVIVSALFVLVIVNAFNFIDGIDGLAASTGIISSAFFGVMFLSINDGLSAVLSFSLCGALAAFLIFNFYPAKIFMGDTGTLVTGFILALLAIQLTEGTRTASSSLHWLNYRSAPVIALALLILPVIDFIRVTIVRLLKGQSPIRADKNHIHHVLVATGLNHLQTTMLLIIINLIFIGAAFLLRKMDQSILFFCMIAAGMLLSQVPYFLVRSKVRKNTL